MRLTKAVTGVSGCDPEVRLGSDSVSDDVSEIRDPLSAQGSEDSVIEGSAGVDVDALDGEVIEHLTTLRGRSDSEVAVVGRTHELVLGPEAGPPPAA
jgi:hypothetical protein